jgi:hypothetical protein
MAIRVDGESAIIAVPVLYPSGSSCSVQITFNRDRCFVSDLALGHMEAQMQGADTFYGRSAKEAAQRFGVGFDGLSMFAAWASIDKIEAAISMVANASANAVTVAMFKAMEEKERNWLVRSVTSFIRILKLRQYGRLAMFHFTNPNV